MMKRQVKTIKMASFETLLTRLDAHPIPETGIPVILVARNEGFRLPAFFDYYRSLGVSRFYVCDDHSTDGSRDWLLQQPDCAVFEPHIGYAEADFGLTWQKALLDRFCKGSWALIVDADELLIYPHVEKISLPRFCTYLEAQGKTGIAGFLLDMYPEGDLANATYEVGRPFIETCGFFDTEYSFPNRFSAFIPFGRKALPSYEVIGGPRMRLFYPEQTNPCLFCRLKNRLVWRGAKLLRALGLWQTEDAPHSAPALYKVPLVKWDGKVRYASAHTIQKGTLATERCVLLHFKFFANFQAKAIEESQRGEHFMGGMEYKRYLRALSLNPHMVFKNEKSRSYSSSDDVLAAGLMSSTRALDAIAR